MAQLPPPLRPDFLRHLLLPRLPRRPPPLPSCPLLLPQSPLPSAPQLPMTHSCSCMLICWKSEKEKAEARVGLCHQGSRRKRMHAIKISPKIRKRKIDALYVARRSASQVSNADVEDCSVQFTGIRTNTTARLTTGSWARKRSAETIRWSSARRSRRSEALALPPAVFVSESAQVSFAIRVAANGPLFFSGRCRRDDARKRHRKNFLHRKQCCLYSFYFKQY